MKEKWTPEEIKLVQKFYEKKGAAFIAKKINRSTNAIMAQAAKLNIRFSGVRAWYEWEKRYLLKNYHVKKNASIARSLKRSIPSVVGMAKNLGLIKAGPADWTEEERDVLRKLYSDRKNSLEEMSRLTGRTRAAILIQAQVLGLKRPPKEHMWTRKEHNYVAKHYAEKS